MLFPPTSPRAKLPRVFFPSCLPPQRMTNPSSFKSPKTNAQTSSTGGFFPSSWTAPNPRMSATSSAVRIPSASVPSTDSPSTHPTPSASRPVNIFFYSYRTCRKTILLALAKLWTKVRKKIDACARFQRLTGGDIHPCRQQGSCPCPIHILDC